MSDVPDDIANGFTPYNDEAPLLRKRYAVTPFEERHALFRNYYPKMPSNILDVGAGTGVDAKGFADLGHNVVAVEPADEMRALAVTDNDHVNITWINDYLPTLENVQALGMTFSFILASASFMHLRPERQRRGFERLSELLSQGGYLAMSLRHGPVPEGRIMFDISREAAEELGVHAGLDLVEHTEGQGRKNVPGVTWSNLVFVKDAD